MTAATRADSRETGVSFGLLFAFLVLPFLGGCGDPAPEGTDPMPMDEMEMPGAGMDRGPEEGMGMAMDTAMMQRHADEAEEMAEAVEEHVRVFRALSPEEQHDQIALHTAMVARTVGLVNRQMGEMSMGMPMDDEAMGRMMGMSAEEHREMMDRMATLRAEAEELQTAPHGEIGERMPAHLDGLEALGRMIAEMGRAMREM